MILTPGGWHSNDAHNLVSHILMICMSGGSYSKKSACIELIMIPKDFVQIFANQTFKHFINNNIFSHNLCINFDLMVLNSIVCAELPQIVDFSILNFIENISR